MFLETPAVHQLLSKDVTATEEYLDSVSGWLMRPRMQVYRTALVILAVRIGCLANLDWYLSKLIRAELH